MKDGGHSNDLDALNSFVPRIDTVIHATGAVIDILRLDEIHPYISGNKWYKLKHNMIAAQAQHADTLITFGGAYSNHLLAAATVAKLLGMTCVCIIRGEAPAEYNPRLKYIQQTGALLHFVSRQAYRLKEDSEVIQTIIQQYPRCYLIPEGGANALGVIGCRDIMSYVPRDYTIIGCTAGTGAMAAGILSAASSGSEVWVFPAIKLPDVPVEQTALYADIYNDAGKPAQNLNIISGYAFGGYARSNETLLTFIRMFKDTYHISLDAVYNGKMFFGVWDMLDKGMIDKSKRLLLVHCGGVFPGE